jgi:uncharacterized protein (DUF488 family)
MAPERPMIFTVGYEGRTHAQLAQRLREAGVARVIDVRASARSPRPGFSKAPLGRALEKAGFQYLHMPEAGNPFRAEAAQDLAAALARFRQHLAERPGIVEAVLAAAGGARTALLCAEANPRRCHRSVLAERIAEIAPEIAVVSL